MHTRRLACFLLGLWLGAGVFMEWVSRENVAVADRILAQPDPAAAVRIAMLDKAIGKNETRLLLRYEASEQNRSYYELWEIVQVVLAALFFFFLLFGTTEGKVSLALALTLLILVLLQRFLLTPELSGLGKLLDFSNPALVGGERERFRVTHAAYTAMEVAKWGLQIALGAVLIARGRVKSTDANAEIEMTARRR